MKVSTPKELSVELAEETGIHFDDGSMNKYQGQMVLIFLLGMKNKKERTVKLFIQSP